MHILDEFMAHVEIAETIMKACLLQALQLFAVCRHVLTHILAESGAGNGMAHMLRGVEATSRKQYGSRPQPAACARTRPCGSDVGAFA